MKYLLDSDIVGFLYNKTSPLHPLVLNKLSILRNDDEVLVSLLTVFELEYSFCNAEDPTKKQEIRKAIQDIKTNFEVVALAIQSAPVYGEIKALIKSSRRIPAGSQMRKHNIDLMIASTAIVESCILVSTDKIYSDLSSQYPKLKHENWVQS